MGAGASSMEGSVQQQIGLGDLPESCVAEVLRRLEPLEICRLARLSRAFRGAAAADFVWETKLPGNYQCLMEKAKDGKDSQHGLSKKEIYAQLCRPNPFDGGTKEFWLDKCGGGICISISSKALSITGINDRRCWKYISTEESRFHTVAYLQQIWWFEVSGNIEFLFPAGTYSLFFRVHLGRASRRLGHRVCSPEHVHGWNIKPVRFQLSTSDGQHATSQCFLDAAGGWIHYHVGDFAVENPGVETKVEFSMTQIDCTHSKRGLCLDSVLIFPKGFGSQNVHQII